MTIKEAIEIIKVAQAEVEWEYPMDYAAAFDVAIECMEKCDKPLSRRLIAVLREVRGEVK